MPGSRAPARLPQLVATNCLALMLAVAPHAARATSLDAPLPVRIRAQDLGPALRALARQADLQILFDPRLVAGQRSVAVAAILSPRAALERLLAATGLEAEERRHGIVVIRRSTAVAVADAAPRDAPPERPSPADPPPLDIAGLEEIIVTAQRRAERVQDVPVSITVHSQRVMNAQGARSIDDVSRLTPGVTFVRAANNNNAESSDIAIRGIASDAGAATTGVYIDDTPIHGRHLSFASYNTYPALFDIERVEVLRGPQGTLFGAGSEGGTVRFITPEPDLRRAGGFVRGEYAVTEHGSPVRELGAAGGAPLVAGRLAFRGSASWRREGGTVDRIDWHRREVVDADANTATTATARLALKWAASDWLTLTPSLSWQRREVDDTAAWWAPRPGEPDPTGGQFQRPLQSGNAVASPSNDEFWLAALKLEWDLGPVRLFSNSSWFRRDQRATTDYSQFDRAIFFDDPYPPPGERGFGDWGVRQRNWTQELRLESTDPAARVTWTAGLFLQRARETTRHRVYDADLLERFGLPRDFGEGYIYVEDPRVGVDRQVALFGQADVKLTRRLSLTLGARYARTQFRGAATYPETLVVGPAVFSEGRQREHPFTPRVGLTWRVDADRMLYASIAKGFRIGGTNPKVGQFCYGGPDSALGSIGLDDVPPSYDSDHVWSYELGAKTLLGDGRAILNASAWLVRWSNIQQNVPLTACGFQFTGNLGEAESRGLDLQAVIRPNDALTVGTTFAYTRARFTKTVQLAPAVQSIVRDGDRLAGAPWTVAAFAEAQRPLWGGEGYMRVDWQYAARQQGRVPAQNPLNGNYALWFEGVPAQNYASLRFGIRRAGLDVSLFAQNLFDTRPRLTSTQDIATAQGGTPLFYAISWRPRTLGMTASWSR